jgi:uncharacterized Rmd1/YagE family protein
MMAKQDIVSMMYLLDKPDEAWNDEILDQLYQDASEMFELKERYRTIDHKLRMIQENIGLLAEFLSYRRADLLEATIILLILIEVILFIYELWLI